MSIFAELAKLLGVRVDQAPDIMKSEHSVRESLAMSRRRLLVGAGAVAAGSAFGFLSATEPVPMPMLFVGVDPGFLYSSYSVMVQYQVNRGEWVVIDGPLLVKPAGATAPMKIEQYIQTAFGRHEAEESGA